MLRRQGCALGYLALVSLLLGAVGQPLWAAPYASGLRDIGGGQVEFILNEPADNVKVNLNVGGTLDLGALGKGRHTFALGGATSYDVAVSRNAPAGYVRADDNSNRFTHFERPGGLVVNTNPASPFFGTVYVNVNRALNVAAPVSTASGRPMGNGIYSLSADRMGMDLPTRTVPANPDDASLAKTAGLNVDLASSSSWYRIGMDAGGNLLAVDWTNTLGGMKVLSPDLTTGQILLRTEGGPTGGVPSDDSDEFGPLPLHGSINGEPQAIGTYGTPGFSVAAMDEDLDADLAVTSANDGNSIWRWNIGATTSNFAGAPKREIAVGDLYTVNGQPRATSGRNSALSAQPVGVHSDNSPVFLDFNIGVTANAQYNQQFNKWYLSGARANGNDSSSLVIVTPEGASGDGRDIQVDWASKQFTLDKGLDGYVDVTAPIDANSTDIANDIFRNVHSVAFSPDNTIMYVMRRVVSSENPVLGFGTPLGAKILAVPLDSNGLPNIQVSDNGTPGNTADDIITNVTPIFTLGNQGAQGSFAGVKTDAAGNVYFTDNISERLEYYSLGGNTLATTSSAGTFSIVPITITPIAGDYNSNGTVGPEDYTLWASKFGQPVASAGLVNLNPAKADAVIDASDYTFWRDRTGGAAAAAAVPETASDLAGPGVAQVRLP